MFIFIISCTPVNLSKQNKKNNQETTISEKSINTEGEKKVIEEKDNKKNEQNKVLNDVVLDKEIIALFAIDDDKIRTEQFLNTYELGIYNLGINDVLSLIHI